MTNNLAGEVPANDDALFDVVQVGYGPVGQTMAALLGQRGHRVAVVDRQPMLYTLPRVGGIDHEIMRVLQSVGVAHEFEPRAYPVDRFDWLNAEGKILLRFDWSREGPSGWSQQYLIYQADLEEALDRAVRARPEVQLYQGWEAVRLCPGEGHVELTVRHRGTGDVRRLCGRYLIGADGANGFVRQAAGIGWTDLGYRSHELVIDYRPHDPLAHITDLPDLAMVCDPARPGFLMRRLGWKHARWEFALLPGETPQEMQDPRRAWELLAPWVTPADGELIRHVVYPFRSLLADEWRRGPVLLVGDAAHVMPPVIGQGVCTGIRDAATLAWKLDLVLRGSADDGLLDTYTAERRPHASALIDMAVGLSRMWEITDRAKAAERDADLLNGTAHPPRLPGLVDGVLHRDGTGPVPPAGQLFVQGPVGYRGRSGRYDGVIGQGFQVLAWNADPLSVLAGDQVRFLREIGAHLVRMNATYRPAGDVVDDLRGVYARWFTDNDVEAVIVRPDYYIFGAVSDLAELPHLVDELRRHLRVGTSTLVDGFVEPGFEHVREVFIRNFTERGEVGAAVCVYQQGRPVVDLAGGVIDPTTGSPYRGDTLQPVFSTTKGVVAAAANMLADRGRLDLDAPVAEYWPEFAQNGKRDIPVRWLLTHQAGLAAIDRSLTFEELLAWDPVIERLAEQEPNWAPGTAHGYHTLTYGFLVGEVVRRVTGVSVGEWLSQEIAAALGVEFFIGLPPELEGRVAPVLPYPEGTSGLAKFTELGPSSLPYRAVGFVHPPLLPELINDTRVHRAQLPSLNGIGTARALATIWASLIGEVNGVRLLSAPAMERARTEQVRGPDLVDWSFPETAIGLGFQLPTEVFPFGGPGSFGSAGLGGSRAWALPERGLAFGYVMNQPQARCPDEREVALSRAVLAAAG